MGVAGCSSLLGGSYWSNVTLRGGGDLTGGDGDRACVY
jgi:hypothetical protein